MKKRENARKTELAFAKLIFLKISVDISWGLW